MKQYFSEGENIDFIPVLEIEYKLKDKEQAVLVVKRYWWREYHFLLFPTGKQLFQ